MPRRITIVEDDPAIRQNYRDALVTQGYEVTVFEDRKRALESFRTRLPDLALLDIGLGSDVDGGFALCRELRSLSPTLPIIFLTARDSDFDVVSGLRMGADDYVTKDVSLPHLFARIGALFRRMEAAGESQNAEETLVRGQLTLDVARVVATWKGRRVDLTLTEFWLIHAMAKHPGHVKDREALMTAAKMLVDDSTITSHVKRVRRKFEAIDDAFDRIETVYGMGYRWNPESVGP
ncbi:MAG: proteobacterial dedicated sortase system response regulator [Vicinamibacteria bacterium]